MYCASPQYGLLLGKFLRQVDVVQHSEWHWQMNTLNNNVHQGIVYTSILGQFEDVLVHFHVICQHLVEWKFNVHSCFYSNV